MVILQLFFVKHFNCDFKKAGKIFDSEMSRIQDTYSIYDKIYDNYFFLKSPVQMGMSSNETSRCQTVTVNILHHALLNL